MSKYDHDQFKEAFLSAGYPYGKACGLAEGAIINLLTGPIAYGRPILVVFGAPGSGKSHFVRSLEVTDGDALILEVSGLSVKVNKFLLAQKPGAINYAAIAFAAAGGGAGSDFFPESTARD